LQKELTKKDGMIADLEERLVTTGINAARLNDLYEALNRKLETFEDTILYRSSNPYSFLSARFEGRIKEGHDTISKETQQDIYRYLQATVDSIKSVKKPNKVIDAEQARETLLKIHSKSAEIKSVTEEALKGFDRIIDGYYQDVSKAHLKSLPVWVGKVENGYIITFPYHEGVSSPQIKKSILDLQASLKKSRIKSELTKTGNLSSLGVETSRRDLSELIQKSLSENLQAEIETIETPYYFPGLFAQAELRTELPDEYKGKRLGEIAAQMLNDHYEGNVNRMSKDTCIGYSALNSIIGGNKVKQDTLARFAFILGVTYDALVRGVPDENSTEEEVLKTPLDGIRFEELYSGMNIKQVLEKKREEYGSYKSMALAARMSRNILLNIKDGRPGSKKRSNLEQVANNLYHVDVDRFIAHFYKG